MTHPTPDDPTETAPTAEAAVDPLLHLYRAVREGQKERGPMKTEEVLEVTERESLPGPLRRRDWVIGGLRFFCVIGVLHESDGRYEALHPAAVATRIKRFADLLTG